MREQPPSGTSVAFASVIAVANGLWTALVLGGAVVYGATCDGDTPPGQQACETDALAWGLLWLVGQIVLVVPTGWATHVLIWAEKARPSPGVRVGLLGVAATLAIPLGLLALGFIAGR
jgi:hypothetical protein